jgi:uncharacterized protein (TIGR02001 family)
MNFKTLVLSTALLATFSAMAQTAPAEPEDTLAYNVGLVTDYRYRGLAQGAKNPALQGGADYTDKSGLYVGTWASTISWIKDSAVAPATAKGPVELDIYGGYRGNLSEDIAFDIGGLEYDYVGNTLSGLPGLANANTFEVYLALTKGAFTAKISDSTTNLFGTVGSKGSRYLDLSYTFDLGDGMSLVPHVGDQYVAGANGLSYDDYSLTLNKDLGDGLAVSAAAIGTNFKNRHGFASTLPGSGSKDLGASTLVLGVKKSF